MKSEKKRASTMVTMIIIIVALALGVTFFVSRDGGSSGSTTTISSPPPPPPPPKDADPRYACALLENLARGMIFLSVKNGGGGKRNFTSDISELKPCIMTKAYDALPGGSGYGGYMARLEEFPAGDGFRSNFLLIAYPASGYRGSSFAIDKSEEVREYGKQQE